MGKVVRWLGGSVLILSFVICCLSLPARAWGGPAPKKEVEEVRPGVFLIDNFESGSLRSPREWWTFDIRRAEIVSNISLTEGDKAVAAEVGKYSMFLNGEAKNWYAGGCGTYIAKENQDLSKYNSFQIDVYGNGESSGTLKIELFDDDNSNWQVEQDPAKSYAPIYDDKFVYDIRVDWSGWKRLTIPLNDFVDDNPKVGDDIWNPQQNGGSGGLLQLQFICLAGTPTGAVNYNPDNISLTVSEE
jgi:hypothetical protein